MPTPLKRAMPHTPHPQTPEIIDLSHSDDEEPGHAGTEVEVIVLSDSDDDGETMELDGGPLAQAKIRELESVSICARLLVGLSTYCIGIAPRGRGAPKHSRD
jgi:hypothetical protein